MWVLYELTANQKNCHRFKVLSLYSTQKQWTISWSDYDMQWKVYFIWQLTSPVVGLRWPAWWLDWEEAPKHFPKPTLHQKKIMVTVWWSAARLTCDSFWISVKLLYLGSMLSELMRCTENWNACSQHWSTERAQFFSMTTIFTWSLANWLPLLQASAKCFHRKQKIVSKSSSNPQAWIFTLQE